MELSAIQKMYEISYYWSVAIVFRDDRHRN